MGVERVKASWRSLEPTEKQVDLLRRSRREIPATRGEAAALLDECFAHRRGR